MQRSRSGVSGYHGSGREPIPNGFSNTISPSAIWPMGSRNPFSEPSSVPGMPMRCSSMSVRVK